MLNMNKEIKLLADAWCDAESVLMKSLDKLPNAGCDCDCEDPTIMMYIWAEGDWPEVMQRCLDCGGVIDC